MYGWIVIILLSTRLISSDSTSEPLNVARYIRIFTSLTREEIKTIEVDQTVALLLRPLQKCLAQEITIMVHSEVDYEQTVSDFIVLFGNVDASVLCALDEETLLQVYAVLIRPPTAWPCFCF